MNTFNKVLISLALVAGVAFGQATTTQTTISAALTAGGSSGSPGQTVCLGSSTGVSAPGFSNPAITAIMVDKELMVVNAATPNTLCWSVTRGWAGTGISAHAANAVAWVGPTGGFNSSPFIQNAKVAGTPCTATAEAYLPQIVIGTGTGYVPPQAGWAFNCPTTGVGANLWQAVSLPLNGGTSLIAFYPALDAGANNAITASIPGLPQVNGVCVSIQLAHTLQAGANTFALNGATAVAIKSHFNTATNLATAYAATGIWSGCYNGTVWLDISE